MSNVSSCPSCSRRLNVPDDLIGRLVKCPLCGTQFTGGATPAPPPLPEEPEKVRAIEAPSRPPEAEDEFGPEDRPWEGRDRYAIRRDCEPHRGTLILILGIMSLVMAWVWFVSPVALGLGISAWVMGGRDMAKINARRMDPEGRGLTQAGYVCGIIGTILSGLIGLCCIGYIAFVAVIATTHP